MSTSNGTSHRPVDRVLAEVLTRLNYEPRNAATWPDTDGTGYAITQRNDAERAEKDCRRGWEQGAPSWAVLMRKDVAAAFATADPTQLRGHLIDAIETAARWVADLDSREEQR